MNLNRALFAGVLIFLALSPAAQRNNNNLLLRSGNLNTESNLRQTYLDSFNQQSLRVNNKAFVLLQFESIPSKESRKSLSANGIELLDYIPVNAYTATITGNVDLNALRVARAKALIQLKPEQKMEVHLAKGNFPSWAVKIGGTVDVWIRFPKTFSTEEVISDLRRRNIDIVSTIYQRYRIISLRIASNRIKELASLPFVEYVQPAPPRDESLNTNSRTGSNANFLNASIANGGRGLNGEGVVLGIGDDADIQTHFDFSKRLINRAVAIFNGHGHHTTGTMAGAGNIEEYFRGYAPKATIISQAYNGILNDAPTYVQDYNMVATNNSYGNNSGCDYYGTYDLYSSILDQMAIDLPHLQNVFAAGNSGQLCPLIPQGYKTIYSGYQSAKNVLTVGSTNQLGPLSSFSSRGPVKDGRTKPEIVTMGEGVSSCFPFNTYTTLSGTSMAAPAATGGLGLLYQRFRQLNGNADPENGLMKAVVCNGALDKGNAGPDYQYGYGWMNLLRSVDMIENNHYFISSVSNGSTNMHIINVPNGTARLKVMLYWNDPAASPLSTQALVNDLDLTVTDPSSTIKLPYILDTSSANVGNAATTGADHINNMEQVVIDYPASGSYTIKINGTSIAQNPTQQYFLVYDLLPVELKITEPVTGENVLPGTQREVSWEANGYPSGTILMEYSIDNGITWNTIQSGININQKIYIWNTPNITSDHAMVRITKEGTGESTISTPFLLLGRPTVSLDPVQCESYINLDWTAVAGSTDYEVMILKGDDMQPVGITSATSYSLSGLSKDSQYVVSVRARLNGKAGLRAPGLIRQPNSGTCSGSISDNDLKLDSIVSPITGRIFTSTQLSATSPIVVRIKNLDDNPVSNFTVSYSINGGSWVTEPGTAPIAAGALYTHTFATTADLSVPGIYYITAVVKNAVADPVTTNDTLVSIIKNINNQPIDLTSYFFDNLESALPETYESPVMGLDSISRYDFNRSTIYGRLRTFVNTGIAYSGSKAITLDQNRYNPAGNINFLTGTFNLSSYNVVSTDVRLDFQFNNHGQVANPNNRVWIRGNDTQSWIQAYNLDSNENAPGIYKKTASIEMSRLLQSNGQDFSPSFQVRWGQYGQFPATDKGLSVQGVSAGYTFDDIRLYSAVNDLQMLRVDTPITASCNLSATTKIKVSVRNSANIALTNIPVKYSINNGAWVTESIPSIGPNTVVPFTFSTTADLSVLGDYSIVAVVNYPTDNFRENDTAISIIKNLPLITSFPYLENFESGNGYWYTGGQNVSWEYGTPNSSKIKRAASGAKAWKTRLAGNYNDNELSYLYSPCFNTTGMTTPTLSFSVALDLEDCGNTLCDGAWVEYSPDGINWTKLGASGSGTNWYNKSADQLWSVTGYTRWHVATFTLPTGISTMHLRFVMQSDPATNYEGIAIDDIHIYDKVFSIYDSTTLTSPISQSVSGNSWLHFTTNGKIIASLQPNNQSLGNTNAQVYINTTGVRHTATQYYHDRNITIKPAVIHPVDSVSVRFYFLDSESDSMIFATGCGTCTNISSAYELGVSKYSDPDTSLENGTIADNNIGMWNYTPADNLIKVPYDKGYYWEFKVKDFSEFWLNNGSFGNNIPLPVKMLDFTIQKQNTNDVLAKWTVASEFNVSYYEIELARGNADLQAGHFTAIGQVPGAGNTTSVRNYSFTDLEADKFGLRFYRIKTVNLDGSYFYSPVRSIQFNEAILWQIYPNPSDGLFSLVYQLNNLQPIHLRIMDAKGSLIKEYNLVGSGLPQKLVIDLSKNNYASGVYLLQTDRPKQMFKLYKK